MVPAVCLKNHWSFPICLQEWDLSLHGDHRSSQPVHKASPDAPVPCMKCRDMVHGCMVDTDCTETAAVSHGTSHVITKQHYKYTTWVDIQNVLKKRRKKATNHMQQECSESA